MLMLMSKAEVWKDDCKDGCLVAIVNILDADADADADDADIHVADDDDDAWV